MRRLLVTASVVPSTPILVTLMMEVPSSSATSVLTRTIRRNIPEDKLVHSHGRENLKSYKAQICWILGSNSGEYEQVCVLGHNAVYSIETQQAFRGKCLLYLQNRRISSETIRKHIPRTYSIEWAYSRSSSVSADQRQNTSFYFILTSSFAVL
jgi:hypothetical protein